MDERGKYKILPLQPARVKPDRECTTRGPLGEGGNAARQQEEEKQGSALAGPRGPTPAGARTMPGNGAGEAAGGGSVSG